MHSSDYRDSIDYKNSLAYRKGDLFMFFGILFRRKTSILTLNTGRLPASGVIAAVMITSIVLSSLCLSACGRKPTPTTTETTEDTRPTESIAQVGDVPNAFKEIIEEDRFRHVEAFTDRLMEVTTTSSEDGKTITHTVTMMDLYGENIASYTLETNDAYGVTSVTPTSDGGFIFAVGFNGSYIPGRDQIETGYHSRIIKCDDDGQVLFDKKMDSVEIGALGKCIEKDGRYWFLGRHRAPEELKKYGKGDVYILVIDENGNEVNQRFIGGSRSDRLDNVEKTADGFILEVTSQSDDGDFAGSDAGYHEVNWRIVISDDLEIMEKEIVPDRFGIRIKVGEKDGEPLYSRDEMFSDFDAGFVEAYIDYGDTYLIVSNHQTGQCEHQPAYISSIWYYWETVYSMYDKSGTLVFRASVDSSPDYSKYENDGPVL